MISLYTRRENCSGCGACAAVCPSFAIRMEPDGEGFRYPAVDGARCSECGQCAAVCPMAREREKGLDERTAAYAFQHSRPEVLRRSASGGAFTALAEAFLTRGGKAHVYGAVLRGGKVYHRFVDDPAELPVFSDSKYVESDPGDSAISIRRQLERGEDVLFSGTPCQADGIKAGLADLPEESVREHLLLVEVICNGVGSPLVWQKCWE